MTAMVCSLIAGTCFLVWLGELITEYGIGNGISIIIFAGIITGYPAMAGQLGLAWSQNAVGVTVFA
jgi:preprotein translocase subunit SecY